MIGAILGVILEKKAQETLYDDKRTPYSMSDLQKEQLLSIKSSQEPAQNDDPIYENNEIQGQNKENSKVSYSIVLALACTIGGIILFV